MTTLSKQPYSTPPFGGQGGLDKFFHQPIADGFLDVNFDTSTAVISSVELMKADNSENRYLLSPFLPKVGCGVLAGKPDIGKSQLARQLAIAVATGANHFLDFALTPVHGRALYIATEDDQANSSYLCGQQLKGMKRFANANLSFVFANVFSQHEILLALDRHLTDTPCDLVLVDSFGDIFIGNDGNNNQAMRKNVKSFQYFANKHQCLILFLHHINKASYRLAPSQEGIMGGAGLIQKVRTALQLSQTDDGTKYLTCVKGNYVPHQYKQNSMELAFDEKHFVFTRTGKEIPREMFEAVNQTQTQMQKLQEIADEVFGKEPATYKAFCQKHHEITGKGLSSAKRDHKMMKELEIIEREGKKWKLI